MDLEFILDELDITADPFALCELHGRCDVSMNKNPLATLHYILAGAGEISLPGHRPLRVESGTLVLIPALHQHNLRSHGVAVRPSPECRPAALGLMHLIEGQGGDGGDGRLIALCSNISVGLRKMHNLVDLIREPMIEQVGEDSLLGQLVRHVLREVSAPGPGSRAMIRSLLLAAMIEMTRNRLRARDGALQWMAALRDPRLWPALQAILDMPGDSHSVESLSVIAGMSRSGFAKRFTETYGSGPMELLRDLRMRLACSMLTESDLPVKRIAELVGFRSRSAFSRAFEAFVGTPPQSFRAQNNPDR